MEVAGWSRSARSPLLCELGDQDLGPVVLRARTARCAGYCSGRALGELVDDALTQPRMYGAGDPAVMARMFDLLGKLET